MKSHSKPKILQYLMVPRDELPLMGQLGAVVLALAGRAGSELPAVGLPSLWLLSL